MTLLRWAWTVPLVLGVVGCGKTMVDSQGEACGCASNHVPVCGADGETYANACGAECAGVAVASPGECQVSPAPDGAGTPGECGCAGVGEPVCGADGVTYPTACDAQCAGAAIAQAGECRPECDCSGEPVETVCAVNGRTYSSGCEARCEGTTGMFSGTCEAVCGCREDDNNPVCTTMGTTIGNFCMLACMGMEMAHEGACDPNRCYNECPWGYQPGGCTCYELETICYEQADCGPHLYCDLTVFDGTGSTSWSGTGGVGGPGLRPQSTGGYYESPPNGRCTLPAGGAGGAGS